MKKISLFLSSLLCMSSLYAQSDIEKEVIAQFQQDFNAQNYAAIFEKFSPEAKKAIPLNMFEKVSKDLQQQLGTIQSIEYIESKGKEIAVYKANFEKDRLKLSMSLNNDQQISSLLFTPYIESTAANNKTVNAIQGYPKAIAEKIYQATRTFPEQTQVAIAVLDQDQTHYYGVQKHKDKIQAKANKDKVFAIGSLTKVMTSTILAELVTQNKIKLDDKINPYYAFPFKDNIQVRFQDLANHTSGLPRLPSNLEVDDDNDPYKEYDAAKLKEYLKNSLELEHANNSGKVPHYSNLAVALLGQSLSQSQNKNFAELLNEYVFKKYGMKHSYTSLDQAAKQLVPAFNAQGKEITTWTFDTFLPAGGVLSTASDLTRFAQAQFDAKNAAVQLTQQATTEKAGSYQLGLGWFVREQDNGTKIIWHGGNTAGHSAILMIDLNKKKAVTILANVAAVHPEMGNIEKLAAKLLQE
ncbi:serine hydrolase [Acinetobacter sp. YH16038]|uniref:serine hydrolase n=1 Tax=Acinetobacter sp. YH16038 TaxID=2601183 RepID=UPI0015D1F936|nr:serine hydrolase [Acinetobacter sp. YH16038]